MDFYLSRFILKIFKRDDIHDISQYQRALNFCLLEFGLTLLVCLMQILPDITNKERKDPAAWEEGATLFPRLNFGWFGKLVVLATQFGFQNSDQKKTVDSIAITFLNRCPC